jgi:hypothetical protein
MHADFYPRPAVFTITQPKDDIPGHVHVESRSEASLTKQDLKRLYRSSGSFLHRSKLDDLLPVVTPPPGPQDIVNWRNKVVNLLKQHTILSYDKKTTWICMLTNPGQNGRIAVALGSSP